MRKRILYISNLYPNPIFPTMAAFNRQQINALNEYCDIEVIAPIPWITLLKNKGCQRVREENGVIIHHPAYFYTPRILREWYGNLFYFSIKSLATSLLEKKQFDVIFTSWLYPDAWAAAELARRYNLPLFVKVHGTDVNSLTAESTITRRSLQVAKQAEKVICVSNALKERLIQLGCPENKLEVLYNGIDRTIFYALDKEQVRKQLQIDRDEFVVLYVGNLKKEKGLDELISAFKKITMTVNAQLRLIIIGAGMYRTKCEQHVTAMNLTGKVQFLGSLPHEKIALWMNAASVLCLASYNEGVPNVILEALSCGTKVVATNVGGIPELDCGNGMLKLVPPRAIDSLAREIVSVENETNEAKLPSFVLSWEQNAQRLFSILNFQDRSLTSRLKG